LSGIPLDIAISQTDLLNGLYNVTFVPNYIGMFLIYVSLNGTQIYQSPFTVTWFGRA